MPRNAVPSILLLVLVALGSAAPSAAQDELSSPFSFGGLSNPLEGDPLATAEPVTVTAEIAPATENRQALVSVTATIERGYHIYSITQADGGPGKSVLKLSESNQYRVTGPWRPTTPPESHVDNEIWDGLTIEEHKGSVTWFAPIEIAPGAAPESLAITGQLEAQACKESCQLVKPEFTARLGSGDSVSGVVFNTPQATGEGPIGGASDSGETATAAKSPSLFKVFGAAMLGGLILNLMPCVLPVIGLKVLSFAEQAGHDRGRVLKMNLAYTAGLMSVFLLLAALAAFASYGWGELYTHNEFKISMVILVFAMGLSFLGVWEIPIPGFAGAGKASDMQSREGYAGAFFKGVFTTILATPCSGPFLGAVIGFTLAQPPWMTFAVFAFIGLGMALPYLLIGLFPDLVKFLPKPGAWMETFKQLMGFVLLGTVVFLMWSVDEALYLPLLTTLVAVGFACWWVGRTPLTASASTRNMAWFGGIFTTVAVAGAAFTLSQESEHELPWRPYTVASLAAAQQSGAPVLVDFTADWCLTCKLNLKRAINTSRVKAVVEANGVTPLLADWSDESPEIEEKLAELGSRSIPLLAIYPAGGDEPIILRDLITEQQLLDALHQAGATGGNGDNEIDTSIPEIEIGEALAPGALR